MNFRQSFLAVAAAVALTTAAVATEANAAATCAPLKRLGTGSLTTGSSSPGAVTEGTLEIFNGPEFDVVNRLIPHSGLSAARVPAAHVPAASRS